MKLEQYIAPTIKDLKDCSGCQKEYPDRQMSVIRNHPGLYCPTCIHPALQAVKVGETEQLSSEKVKRIRSHPQLKSPQPLLPARWLTIPLPENGEEPEWDRLKKLPVWMWKEALQATFGGWPDPEHRQKNGKTFGPYLYWRWKEGGKTRAKYLGKVAYA